MVACWRPGNLDRLIGQEDPIAPDDLGRYFTDPFAAFPHLEFEIISTTTEDDRCAMRYETLAARIP